MIKEFFEKKSIGFYLLLGAILCAIIGLITYSVGAQDTYGFEPMVVVMLIIAIVAGLVFAYKDFYNAGSIVVSALMCVAAGIFFNARFIYFSYMYYGVGSDDLSAAMVITVIFLVVMILACVASAFFKHEKAK